MSAHEHRRQPEHPKQEERQDGGGVHKLSGSDDILRLSRSYIIADICFGVAHTKVPRIPRKAYVQGARAYRLCLRRVRACLLYTSDAADD